MNSNLLAERIWPVSAGDKLLRSLVLMIFGSIFVALAAQVSVPMVPVPMTLQTFAVLSVGAAFGARLGMATLILYALEGAVGLPVFANLSGGLPVLMGPTGGYILGFILAAGLVGWLVERFGSSNGWKLGQIMLAGAVLIYVPGLAWLAQFTGASRVLELGFFPFVLGDVVKAVLAALMFPAAHTLLARRP